MEFIPLGSTCSVAYQLQQLKLRQCAYPFDWLRNESMEDITKTIKNNFADFVTSCCKVTESDKFPISTDDQFPEKNIIKDKSLIMKNKYNMKFYHDFDDKTTIEQVNEKYQRRINRFISAIKEQKNICFVRDELKPNKLTDTMITDFIRELKNINSLIEVKMIIILHNPKNQPVKLQSSENITIVNDTADFEDWIRPNVDWKTIFKKIDI